MQMYPGWSARDNYAQSKKRKRKRESESSNLTTYEQSEGNFTLSKTAASPNGQKKCRARYGLEAQERWCKPCK